MRLSLVCMLCLALVGACSDDDTKPNPDGSTADQQVTVDQQTAADSPTSCKEGDKRCDGLTWIQECKNGAWVDTINCADKSLGGQTCSCSITMLYVCSVGPNVCN